MKCYICLTAPDSDSVVYVDMLEATLRSARENTRLELCALYDGPEEHRCYELLLKYGVDIIRHEFSHKQYLEKTYPREFLLTVYGKADSYAKIAGTFMRLDIPFQEKEEEFVLYVDIDVLFMKDIRPEDLPRPKYLAAAPEFDKDIRKMSYFNAGVLVLNVKNMRVKCRQIFDMLKRGERNRENLFDQGYLNQVCFREMEHIPLEYNWKPYWGINDDARIIHFHGMKPGGTLNNSGFCTNEKSLYESLLGHEDDIQGYIYYGMLFFQTIGKDGKLWISVFTNSIIHALYKNTKAIYFYKKKKEKYKILSFVLTGVLLISLGLHAVM